MLLTLAVSLLSLFPRAGAAVDSSQSEFFLTAKPLIERYLAQSSAEYGVDFAIDETTWSVASPRYFWRPWGVTNVWRDQLESSCREVSAILKSSGQKRVRVYVKVTAPPVAGRATPADLTPKYQLVPSCARNALDLAPEITVDGLSKDREFNDREFIVQSTPLIQKFLRAKQKSDVLDESTFRVRRKGIDLEHQGIPATLPDLRGPARNVACRRVRVVVPAENAILTTFVRVMYNHDDVAPYLPAETQSTLKDKHTLRPYQFALVNGCDKEGFFAPAKLRLRPTKVFKKPPVVPES